VHVPDAHAVTTPVSVEAFVAIVCGEPPPVVNCVEVIVSFHPDPVPRVSIVASANEYVAVTSPLSRLAENEGVADVATDKALPVTVPVAVAVAALAAPGVPTPIAIAIATINAARPPGTCTRVNRTVTIQI
jgi:hypothetical protein